MIVLSSRSWTRFRSSAQFQELLDTAGAAGFFVRVRNPGSGSGNGGAGSQHSSHEKHAHGGKQPQLSNIREMSDLVVQSRVDSSAPPPRAPSEALGAGGAQSSTEKVLVSNKHSRGLSSSGGPLLSLSR